MERFAESVLTIRLKNWTLSLAKGKATPDDFRRRRRAFY